MAEHTVEDLVAQIMEHVDPGAVLTKFVLVMEGFDADGQRAVYTSVNNSSMAYDNFGLLKYAMIREETKMRQN